jgi:hypothetical protein
LKWCAMCKAKKPDDQFFEGANTCTKCRVRKWNQRGINITIEQYQTLFRQQEGRCAICKQLPEERGTGLCVDHCHDTGTVRGLVCHPCNQCLANAKDRPVVLRAAAEYLERFEMEVVE